jgi:hypothetical protein
MTTFEYFGLYWEEWFMIIRNVTSRNGHNVSFSHREKLITAYLSMNCLTGWHLVNIYRAIEINFDDVIDRFTITY